MQEVFLIVAKIHESGDGYEPDPDGNGWYQRGSRIWAETQEAIDSIYGSREEAEEALKGLRPKQEIQFAEPDNHHSPINYRKTTEFEIRELRPGSTLSKIGC